MLSQYQHNCLRSCTLVADGDRNRSNNIFSTNVSYNLIIELFSLYEFAFVNVPWNCITKLDNDLKWQSCITLTTI